MKVLSSRRAFLRGLAGTLCVPSFLGAHAEFSRFDRISKKASSTYRGPRVVLIRFGGGVRRAETIEQETTYAPFFSKVLLPQGTLYSNMELSRIDGVETSHSQGTLHILTGGYKTYRRLEKPGLGDYFEATVPTLFEYLRKRFSLQSHETLLVNNENRAQEEFLSFSAHSSYGIRYQSDVLSWFRFKYYYLNEQLREEKMDQEERIFLEKELVDLEKIEKQVASHSFASSGALKRFWKRWGGFLWHQWNGTASRR